ncbi:IS1634 family transposase [Psittacicella hinzii]|uniref:Transposase IS4-like domain-containing protein n=1 Tax=Psittacicella hinzii TaxID=2028575 RepID=A0A3A1YAT0_9GAMM|nr:transposase [Psittacicella hinzii]RIY34641.1 hypothetical protein CKF58_07955 [Psittacicella hinzii]
MRDLIIAHTMDKIGLTEDLQKIRPDEWKLDCGVIMYKVAKPDSSLEKAYTYFKQTNIPDLKITQTTISQVYTSFNKRQLDTFLSLRNNRNQDAKFISLDNTAINTGAKDIIYTAYGHNKDSKAASQVNCLVTVNNQTELASNYRIYWGNINNLTAVRNMVQDNPEFNNHKFVITMDRGLHCKENIEFLAEKGVDFITGLSKRSALFSQALERVNLIRETPDQVYEGAAIGETELILDQDQNFKVRAVVLLDHQQRGEQIATLSNRFSKIKKKLLKQVNKEQILNSRQRSKYRCFYLKQEDNSQLSLEIDNEKYFQDYNLCGFYVLITTDFDSPMYEIIRQYRNKDMFEKFYFNSPEDAISRIAELPNHASLDGICFYMFNASIVRLYMNNVRSSIIKQKQDYHNNKSLATILKELTRLKAIRQPNGKFEIPELKTEYRNLIEALGLDLQNLSNVVPKIFQE